MAVQIDPLGMLSSPLTRLNFFDGLFLRAELLRREQDGVRNLVFQSNMADGPGVAFGLDASVDGDAVTVQPGLAVDWQGRVVLLVDRVEASISDLLDRGRAVPLSGIKKTSDRFETCVDLPPATTGGEGGGTAYYAVVVRHHESACGWEEVRGRACEDACDAAMERPYIVETARVGLCPVVLRTPLRRSQAVVLSDRHLRSLVASAFFSDERDRSQALVSAPGLRSAVWCRGAAWVDGICAADVPVALLAVRAGAKLFLDPWIVRRERMETPPRRYWAGRMRMRPWDVFLAQVLQFQCELAEVLEGVQAPGVPPLDPCHQARDVLSETLTVLEAVREGLRKGEPTEGATPTEGEDDPAAGRTTDRIAPTLSRVGGLERLTDLRSRAQAALRVERGGRRLLVDAGIVELPAAGWLPIDPTASSSLTQQVSDLLGPGVDLRFCAIRADQAAGELESCQHLDRISLLRGLDDPGRRELVDILVPEGERRPRAPTLLFEVDAALGYGIDTRRASDLAREAAADPRRVPFKGVARLEGSPRGPFALYAALAGGVPTARAATAVANLIGAAVRGERLRRSPNFGEGSVSDATLARAAAAARSSAGAGAAAGASEAFLVWIEATLDGNPFTAGRGHHGALALEALAYRPTAQGGFLGGLEADGRYTVDDVAGDGTVRLTVRGHARAHAGDTGNAPRPVTFRLTLRYAAGSLEVNGPADLTAEWSTSPLQGRARLKVPKINVTAEALGRRSEPAGSPGNPYHERARAAITILDNARGGGFADEAGEKLFRTRPSTTDIRTTLDWVLFRRRLRYDCGEAAPVPAEDRRVDVWHLAAASRAEAGRLVKAVQEGNYGGEWARLSTAVFAGDTAELRTSAGDLRRDWRRVGGGDVVVFGGYAGIGSVTQPRARDRLDALVAALAPDAALDGELEVLAEPPGPLVIPGSDAAVLLISVHAEKEGKELCADVFVLERFSDTDTWKLIESAAESEVGKGIEEGRVRRLGQVRRSADGSFDIEAGVSDTIAGIDGLPVVAWADSAQDLTVEEVSEWVRDGLTTAAASLALQVHVREFGFPANGPCPMRVFVRVDVPR